MEDQSIFTNNQPKEISEGLQNFIDSMVEEIVLEGKPFDSQKKYLKKFSEKEGVNYDKLEADLITFLEILDCLKKALSNLQVKLAEEKGRECHISEGTIKKLVNHSSKPRQIKFDKPVKELRMGSGNKPPYLKYVLYVAICLIILGLTYFVFALFNRDNTSGLSENQDVRIDTVVVVKCDTIVKIQYNTETKKELPQKALTGIVVGHEWDDLGLPSGIRWATMNVGATNPTETGSYFSWGETVIKKSYKWKDYKFRIGGSDIDNIKLSKYNTGTSLFWKHKPNEAYYGPVDNRTQLEPVDDVAQQNWKGPWRIPTKDDFMELIKYCDVKWVEREGGKAGIEVTGKNRKQIFLRAGGYWSSGLGNVDFSGEYYTSSLDEDETYCAYILHFSESFKPSVSNGWRRLHGRTIRPVFDIN